MDTTDMESAITLIDERSRPYIGRWNQLISTTNWEKGRIISQWRRDLVEGGASPREYSDDAWSQHVGGVTGQHVGRLRRVHDRFADIFRQFEGLYWSHFQAALDWEDAEMWLEGAVQSSWSVSQMRRQRWETLGAVEGDEPYDEEIVSTELDEDFDPREAASPETLTETVGTVRDAESDGGNEDERVDAKATGERPTDSADGEDGASVFAESDDDTVPFVRPFEHLSELPADLNAAFESFKLALLRHKMEGWREISREDVLASLDALKELALAPSHEGSPF